MKYPWLRSLLVSFVCLSACGSESGLPPAPPITPASLSRGEQLAQGFGSCGFCHSLHGKPEELLSGGKLLNDEYGEVAGPNITSASSGIGAWTDDDLRRLFRSNTRPDESVLYSKFHRGLEWTSEQDLTAIIAYLRSLPKVEQEVERRDISFLQRNTTGFFFSQHEVKGYVPQIAERFKTEYGKYLVDSVAGCARCHSTPGGTFSSEKYMEGGLEVELEDRTVVAPNITSSKERGIGSWSEEDLRTFFETGRTPQGREVDSRLCPIEFYRRAPATDINAVVQYLRTIPAVEE